MTTARRFTRFIASSPQSASTPGQFHRDIPTVEYLWFRIREFADVPENGMALFTGTLAERREKYRYFQAFVRQASVYWSAARTISESAAALPYYYAILQLAKAELLRTRWADQVMGKPIGHGLSHRNAKGTKIRSDRLVTKAGVFPLLYEARTSTTCPLNVTPKVTSLLAMIPEISMEMSVIASTRPGTKQGYHVSAMDDDDAWSLVLLREPLADDAEPLMRKLRRAYTEVDVIDNWREVFAISTRVMGGGLRLFEANAKRRLAGGGPDLHRTLTDLHDAVRPHISPPVKMRVDFLMTPSVAKSNSFTVPLPLIRYAVMFYLSSLVRYQPIKLDPVREGAQAYVMDALVHEVPTFLLASALDGITGRMHFFDPEGGRL